MAILPPVLAERVRGARASRRRPPGVIWVPAALVAVAMLLPLAYLFVRSLEDGWAEVYEVLSDVETFAVLGRSVLLAAVVTVACVAVAVPLAWLTARTDLPGRRAWAVLAAVLGVFVAAGRLVKRREVVVEYNGR